MNNLDQFFGFVLGLLPDVQGFHASAKKITAKAIRSAKQEIHREPLENTIVARSAISGTE